MKVRNLLYAAALIHGGATVTTVDPRHPFHVHLDLTGYDGATLAAKLREMADRVEGARRYDLVEALRNGVIGGIDRTYLDLKRRVGRTREAAS